MTTTTSTLTLKTAIGSYPHHRALKDGRVQPEGATFDHVEFANIGEAFPIMCRELAFDVSEMSITAYLSALVYQKGFTALPVLPLRFFPQPHAALMAAEGSGIAQAKDLEGRSVVERAYARTVGLWVRGILTHEYGVDIGKITWVSVEEEHVPEFRQDAPPNSIVRLGEDMRELLVSGQVAGGVAPGAGPGVAPLIPNAREAAAGYYRRTGVYQINHVIVVRDTLLAAHPWLGASLYAAFAAAKAEWLATQPDTTPASELGLPDNDPLPYGMAANRASLEALVRFGYEQHITPRAYSVEETFPLEI